jgi:type I protein arginine methyltransferase
MSSASEQTNFPNRTATGEIPSFDGDARAKATDFANYFCSYAQLYHQKQMLADHNRMAAYHSAILGNQDVFRDKVVLDIGTGSGILAVWAAQAGARKVYAIEYTDMAKHATQVMKANHVDHIVTVMQCAVEDLVLPMEADGLEVEADDGTNDGTPNMRCVDIIVSEWMGYFLLRESMLDSIIRARDKYLKRSTGLMFPSHTTMYLAPITDEDERRACNNEYAR